MVAAVRNRKIKKKTAPPPWMRDGQPAESIVPMAQQKPITEAMAHLQSQLSTGQGKLVFFLRSSSQRKAMKQMRQMKLPAGSIKSLKTMSWGQWQAVLVIVAWGQPLSCFCFTAMQYEQRQAKMRRGMKKQMIQLIRIAPKGRQLATACGRRHGYAGPATLFSESQWKLYGQWVRAVGRLLS